MSIILPGKIIRPAALAAAMLPVFSQSYAVAESEAPLEDYLITATRSGEPVRLDQIGGSVTVLDAKMLTERQTREVSDILRDVPGLAVNRVAGLTQVRIRGAEGNHTLVLIDGMEVSDPYVGEFDFGSLMADENAKIEVLRGPQSSLYGSDAIAGVIHYISATGSEAPGLRLRVEGGSFGTANGVARIAGVEGALDYAVTASYFSTDGTPDARDGKRDIGKDSFATSFKTIWSASENVRLIAVGRYSYSDAEINNSDNDTSSPTFGLTIDSPGSYFHNEAFYGLLRGEVDLLDGRWTHAAAVQIADTTRKGFDFDDYTYGDKGRRTKASYETTLRFGNEAFNQRVTFALDAEHERYRNTDPSGFAFTGYRSTDNLGLVGEYSLVVHDRLALGASLRHDKNDEFDDSTTYRFQGSYLFDSGTRFRGAIGSGIKNPDFYQLYGYYDGHFIGNADLKPEKSTGWEVGVEQSLADEAVTLGVTWFQGRLKDEIYTLYPAPLYIATPANRTTLSKQRGIEAFAKVLIGNSWRIDAAYSYLWARENGVEEVRRPTHIGNVALSWRAPEDQGGVALVVRYNGKQKDYAYTDPSWVPLTVSLDDYTLVNLNADWALTKQISVTARIENLLDESYEQVFSFRSSGRAAYVGLTARY